MGHREGVWAEMTAFSNLHVLSIHDGEVYVHHFWLLFVLAIMAIGVGRA